MHNIAPLRRMWTHLEWADDLLWNALAVPRDGDAAAWREYSHIIGAEEIWLSRIEGRASRLPIWPEVTRDELDQRRRETLAGYARFLDSGSDADLDQKLTYRNTAGIEFSTTYSDILTHVALHGQYHRGKINAMLRQIGADPVPVDFIAWVRATSSRTYSAQV